jgi:hypothetical protein
VSESPAATVDKPARSSSYPGWLREVGAAVGAAVGWQVWVLALAVSFLVVTWPFRLTLIRSGGLPSPVGYVLYLAGATVVATWPLLVSSWPRFGRWTWRWGFALGGIGLVFGVLKALGLVASRAPQRGSLLYPHLTVTDVAIYQVVFLLALAAYYLLEVRRRQRRSVRSDGAAAVEQALRADAAR